MSYGFTVRAASKAEAKVKVVEEFDKIIELQPVHERDKIQALANANAVIDLLPDEVPEGMEIGVSCNGYISWQGGVPPDAINVTGASVSANAGFLPPAKA